MKIAIISLDDSFLDEIEIKNGKASLSLDDYKRADRRLAYFQQSHVRKALNEVQIVRPNKIIVQRLADGFKFVDVEIDEYGRPPVALCGRFTIADTAQVRQTEEGSCYVTGLRLCGSVWACPICGRRVLQARGQEIKQAVDHFAGKSNFMVTLTARHTKTTDLKKFANDFRNARRKLARTKRFSKFRKLCAGYITTAEITWSPINGWHWHVHELWLDAPFAPDFSEEWMKALESENMECDQTIGYHVTESWDASEYLTKTGVESSERKWSTAKELSSFKKGQSVWDLANKRYDLVKEHYFATKGMRRITWSKNLKTLVGIDDVKDSEILGSGDDEIVIRIPQQIWTGLHSKNLIPDVLEEIELFGVNDGRALMIKLANASWSDETVIETRASRIARFKEKTK